MNVSRISIKNILGIDALEFRPGHVTTVTGRNGTGKTSTIESVKAALKGGHDATLLRKGADKGEVVIVFDNDDSITKTVTQDKSTLKVRQNGKLVTNAASALDELRDIVSVNPIEFLVADSRRRLQILLESVRFDITDEQLSEAAGFECRVGTDALAMVDSVRKGLFDERTGINRAVKEKSSTIEQLSLTVPPNIVGDIDTELFKITQENTRLTSERDAAIQSLTERNNDAIQKLRDQIEELHKQSSIDRDAIVNDYTLKFEPLLKRQAELVEATKTKSAFEQQKKVIEEMERSLEELNKEAKDKNDALDRIDRLKASMLENLPVPGMTITDGEIYIDGVPFDRINTSNQIRVCMQLAAQRAGELKLICVDGLEALDQERFDRFVDAASKTDCQFIVTRVTNRDFAVESV